MKSSKFTSTPLFPRQALVALLLPLIAEQALSVTIGLADTLMVSSVGEAAVSGVSLVDSFNTLMIQIMSALATGGAVVTSQYIGRQEPKDAKNAAAQILFILSSFSLLVAAVVVAGRHAILRGIFGSIDVDVMRYAETYFLLSALSYPFIGLYNAGAALFRAQGNSKISMLSSLVMNVVNIGGNAVLIYGFGMGVMGAALASLVSRAIACAVVLYLLQKPGCALRVDSLRAMAPNGGLIRRILRVGIPAGIENGMFQIGKLSVSSLTSTLGTAAIAANAVANTTTTFLNIPANAVGMAALTVVGQCLGAGEKEQAMYYSRRLMLTAYCGAWVMNLSAFFFANRFAVSLFNLSPEAQAMALNIMVWFNIVSLFIWPSSFTMPNILRAAGDARFTMTVSIVSMWAFRVGFCYLCVLAFHGGLLGVLGAFWYFARSRKKSFLEVSDFVAPLVPQGLFFGRLGNFINGELWGKVSDAPWAMVFPGGGPYPRHPSQLYEALLEGMVLFIVVWIYSGKPRKPGAVSGLFAVGYGLFRFMVEFVRVPDAQLGYLAFGWLTMGQVLCLPLILAGLWLLLRRDATTDGRGRV